jgi:hypothetical protein
VETNRGEAWNQTDDMDIEEHTRETIQKEEWWNPELIFEVDPNPGWT